MSENCENKNPLQRDGTSQQQRLLKALIPSYVSVDERSIDDLRDLVARYAQLFKYYNLDNTTSSPQPDDWTSFFISQVIDEAGQKTEPHYALFMAFIEILKFAQEDINTITKRHLDFYYKDVLRIKEKPAVPDQVFIIFELAQEVLTHLVAKASELNGGPDKTGVDLIYDTEKDIVVNVAQTTEFKSLFYNKAFDARLYASPVANSANGLGEPIETEEPRWRTFGAISDLTAPFNSPLADRPQAGVGFAFASPVLFLGEGNRNVKITLQFSNLQYSGLTTPELKNAFNVLFSGEKEWIAPSTNPSKSPQDFTYLGAPNTNTIIIQRTVTVDQPAIIAYNQEVLLEPFNTQWPVMKIMLNTQDTSNPYIYTKLKNLVVTNCTVTVDVDGVKNLVLQNDESVLDASKPFLPFGGRPVLTSNFYIGSNEVFRKNLSSVDLNMTWKGLPTDANGFLNPFTLQGYYHNYIPAPENSKRINSGFRTNISILNGHTWSELVNSIDVTSSLFDAVTPLQSFRKISIANSKLSTIPAEANMTPVEEFDNSTTKGFMRLSLANVDFGHSDYQLSYATQAINASKPVGGGLDNFPLPNEPYTPTIAELTLDYVSSTSISLVINTASSTNQAAFDNRVDQFFHVQPFGVNEVHPFIVKTSPNITLMPLFNDEGTLYIGIENLIPPQNLSVLFKVAEGSADPDLPKQNVIWSYLKDNEWYEFPKFNILSDSTNGLLTSGIIEFSMPKKIDNDNSILNPGLYWIKAAVTNMSRAICDMIDIRTQAVTAVFVDNGNDVNHLRESLPAETIKELVDSVTEIGKVIQPYASFGGKVKEENDDFYTRVSERLRHKNRAVMIFDHERIVLEAFPSVYKVKCMNHTKYISALDINEMAPGHVSLAVVSNMRNKNAVNPLQPKTSLLVLSQINDLIKAHNPPLVEVHVKNPIYEEIIVHFNVKLRPGFDTGFYGNLLNTEIKKFLSPWAFEDTDIVFGVSIHGSVILNFIEERPYVDFVACFSMDQVVAGVIIKGVEEAVPSTGASILTSAATHDIFILETEDCECDDNLVTSHVHNDDCTCDHDIVVDDPKKGVGGTQIGKNFIVGNGGPFKNSGIGFMEIDKDFEVD